MKIKLDAFEQALENEADKFKPVTGAKRDKILEAIALSRKTQNINIRINAQDLAEIREAALNEGLPYQTLISSVLHKYVTRQLVDEKSLVRALQLVK